MIEKILLISNKIVFLFNFNWISYWYWLQNVHCVNATYDLKINHGSVNQLLKTPEEKSQAYLLSEPKDQDF